MAIFDVFTNLAWGPTLQVNIVRSAVAGIVWAIIMAFDGSGSSAGAMLALPIVFPLVVVPAALVGNALWKAGVPFAGWINILASLIVVVADPFMFVLHKVAPQLVPVRKYGFVNFVTLILVYVDDVYQMPATLPESAPTAEARKGLIYDSGHGINCVGRVEDGNIYDSGHGSNCIGRVLDGNVYGGAVGGDVIGRVEDGAVYDSVAGGNCIGRVEDGQVFDSVAGPNCVGRTDGSFAHKKNTTLLLLLR